MMIPVGRDAHRRPFAPLQPISRQASFPTSPWARTQRMALLRRAQAKPTGFTLVELMITVAIIGLLSAVAIPQYLNARDRADAKSKIGELIGIAKECAVFNAEADDKTTSVKIPSGETIECGGSSPSTISISSREWQSSISVECLRNTVEATKVAIEVTDHGQMSCKAA